MTRCPACNDPRLAIEALSWCAVLPDGDLGSPQAPVHYDSMSRARCGCGWYGTVEELLQAQPCACGAPATVVTDDERQCARCALREAA